MNQCSFSIFLSCAVVLCNECEVIWLTYKEKANFYCFLYAYFLISMGISGQKSKMNWWKEFVPLISYLFPYTFCFPLYSVKHKIISLRRGLINCWMSWFVRLPLWFLTKSFATSFPGISRNKTISATCFPFYFNLESV